MSEKQKRAKPASSFTRTKKSARPATTRKRSDTAHVKKLKAELEEKISLLTDTNRQLKRKIFDLYTIFEISRNFNAVLNYQSLLDTFIYTCLGQVGALKGAIFLKRDGHPDKFFMAKSKGSGDFPRENEFFPEGSKLAGYLSRLNRPVPTAELLTDFSTKSEAAILKHFNPGIVVPLIYQTRLSGIFAMSEKISGREFGLDDIEFLSILGNQISVAIENARLYEGERMATQQLRAAQQQLVQTEKLAALGEMSAKIAHEVNNPLGIIKNYMVLLQREHSGGDNAGDYVGIVSEEIDRIARIVKQLLDFYRPTGVTMQKVSVTKLLDDVLTLMERQLASGKIEVVKKYRDNFPRINASPEGLKQVFLNLIINARDAMEDGGTLTVGMKQAKDNLVIDFLDTGPGIPPEIIPRIFEPFFTTKEQGEGTGLGLSVCYGIIKNHKGSIRFRNMNPGGCFEIMLPLVLADKTNDYSI
jgi:signal transduction histidine kinase